MFRLFFVMCFLRFRLHFRLRLRSDMHQNQIPNLSGAVDTDFATEDAALDLLLELYFGRGKHEAPGTDVMHGGQMHGNPHDWVVNIRFRSNPTFMDPPKAELRIW